ncbi:MAG TPA: aminotransferase class V-fold PLP-dependent enzyme [Pirellulales bacterium]|jgi:isopenicillin-N epimerase|nr:aminotransferase class V-fold PLP-dependent enzyme [Pirellulales bacterium]
MKIDQIAAQRRETAASQFVAAWPLDPAITFLNHGSFGACPSEVLARQDEFRRQLEAEPVRFFLRELPPLLDAARGALATFVGAPAADLVFTSNATAGVNSVLRSLEFQPGDEILITDHGYNACNNVARYLTGRLGVKLVVAKIAVPVAGPESILEAILARATPRTKLAMIDHVTSPTAIVFPIGLIVAALAERGIDTLVDGAHAPGMLALDLEQLGAAYYAGNCHKWLCAPKGAGFLHVRPDRQRPLQPATISHGFNQARPDYSRLQDRFDWVGTLDPSPWLCVAEAIRFLDRISATLAADRRVPRADPRSEPPKPLAALMQHNHELAQLGSRQICQRLGLQPTCGPSLSGSMSAILLPVESAGSGSVPHDTAPDDCGVADEATSSTVVHRFYRALNERYAFEVPVYECPLAGRPILRISAQVYNSLADYERLAAALEELLSS